MKQKMQGYANTTKKNDQKSKKAFVYCKKGMRIRIIHNPAFGACLRARGLNLFCSLVFEAHKWGRSLYENNILSNLRIREIEEFLVFSLSSAFLISSDLLQ